MLIALGLVLQHKALNIRDIKLRRWLKPFGQCLAKRRICTLLRTSCGPCQDSADPRFAVLTRGFARFRPLFATARAPSLRIGPVADAVGRTRRFQRSTCVAAALPAPRRGGEIHFALRWSTSDFTMPTIVTPAIATPMVACPRKAHMTAPAKKQRDTSAARYCPLRTRLSYTLRSSIL